MTNPRAALTDRLGSASRMRRAAVSEELVDVVRIEVLSVHPSSAGYYARVRVHGADGGVTEREFSRITSGGTWLWSVQPSGHEPSPWLVESVN